MTPAAIIKEAMADGVNLVLSTTGTIKATGKQHAVNRWLSVIREHKPEILATLARHDDAEDLREHFEERAGILEHDAGLPRPEAEIEAARITATYARNKAYLWASLRAALSDYPALLSQLPDRPGPVDALPLGVAKLAVLTGRRVVRPGAHEVKA